MAPLRYDMAVPESMGRKKKKSVEKSGKSG
jgi:hypothetical protein